MARNDITGDAIANTKGSAEKYAQGWEGIFGAKKTGDEACWEMVNGSSITFKDTGAEPLVGLSSAVMALDFHDSQPVNHKRHHVILYGNILENEILWECKSA